MTYTRGLLRLDRPYREREPILALIGALLSLALAATPAVAAPNADHFTKAIEDIRSLRGTPESATEETVAADATVLKDITDNLPQYQREELRHYLHDFLGLELNGEDEKMAVRRISRANLSSSVQQDLSSTREFKFLRMILEPQFRSFVHFTSDNTPGRVRRQPLLLSSQQLQPLAKDGGKCERL